MAESFNKREQEKRRQQKQEEKERRKAERKANSAGGGLDNMIAYVDEFGRITDTPPDPTKRQEIKAEDIEIGVPKRTAEEEDPTRRGRIDRFDEDRGFGFIQEDGTRERFFVHISEMMDEVKVGQAVIFEVMRGTRGLNAVKVRKA
jgi:cold shock CspA family protein